MILSLGLFQQALIVATFVVVFVAVFSYAILPLIQNKLQLFSARAQANIILFVCFLPLLTVVFVLISSFLPSLQNVFGFGPEHCGSHDNPHSHLCTVHPPLPASHWLTWITTLFAMVLVVCTAHIVRSVFHSIMFKRRFSKARQNALLKKNALLKDVWLVDSNIPFAFVTGLVRTKIIISTALKQALPKAQLNIVLAHEREHKKHHDVLSQMIARAVSFLHFPGVRKLLLAHLALATEKACDEAAAKHSGNCPDNGSGSRAQVAQTLVAIERLYRNDFSAPGNVALGVAGNSVVLRVEALLDDTKPPPLHSKWLFFALVIVMIGAAMNYNRLHHLVEAFLGYITH